MVCRVQVAAEPERCTVRLAGRLTAVQLEERLRVCASRRLPSMSPISLISFRSTPRWFTPRLAAGGAERVGVAEDLRHMTGPM
jgi:hypothetical protein